tara:strand:- start:612 stop:794 length:183 start_codon:yes stop_codon:yes gene_type:complete
MTDLQIENRIAAFQECLGAINATYRRQTHALERIAKAIENIEHKKAGYIEQQGTVNQEVN